MRNRAFQKIARPAMIGAAGCALAITPAAGATAVESPLDPTLALEGHPLVHTFATDVPGDSVEGLWQLTARGDALFTFEGLFSATDAISPQLAEGLAVEFGVLDGAGAVERWAPAGTLAAPLPYTSAVGSTGIIGPSDVPIRVRVTLADTSQLPTGEPQTVAATFSISYLASPSQPLEPPAAPPLDDPDDPEGPDGDEGAPTTQPVGDARPPLVDPAAGGAPETKASSAGVLATTGPQIWVSLLVALGLSLLGVLGLRRRRR